MANRTSPSTGVGKKDTSRNALKHGVFSNALLDDEDPEDIEAIVEEIKNRFDVDDYVGEICVRRFVQTTLQAKRSYRCQLVYAEGYMQSETMRQEFCRQVGLPSAVSQELPTWYFLKNTDFKLAASFIEDCLKEARHLYETYNADRLQKVQSLYPNLWEYLMGEDGKQSQRVLPFGDRLGKLYKKTTTHENLISLIEDIKNKHKYDLLWVANEQRFESIVMGLRAQAMLDTTSNPNWTRADSLFHRRFQDLLQTLVSLKHEKNRLTQPALEVLESKPKRKSKALAKDVEPKKNT